MNQKRKTEAPQIPAFRFSGFSGEWEEVKYSNVYSYVRNGFVGTATPYYADVGIRYIQGRNIKEGRLLDNGYVKITPDFHKSRPNSIVKENDLLMVQSGHVGDCAVVSKEFDGANCHAILISTPKCKEECFSIFYSYYFLSNAGKKKIYRITTGNTVKHILSSDLKRLFVPKINIQEQTQIGEFFQTIDRLIELQSEKVAQAERYKKAMLQRMFPQKGEKAPRLRFEGFSGEWESKRLELIIKTYSFRKYLAEPEDKGLYPVIQQGNKPIIGYSNNEPFMSYKEVILFGDHTLSLYRPTSPFLLSTDGIKILSLQGLEPTYAFYLISRYMPLSEGYKRHFSILKEQMVFYPKSIEEQTQIGNFFEILDQRIEAETEKLNHYQTLKRAMLQRMFV